MGEKNQNNHLKSKNKWYNEEDEVNITPITTEQLINKFKQSKSTPKEDKIEVQNIEFNLGRHLYNEIYKDEPPFGSIIWTGSKIPDDKQLAIKQAIQNELNK